MFRPQVSLADVERLATGGSPLLVQAVGRVFGIGPAERRALAGDPGPSLVPTWAWAVAALGAGVVIGVRVQRRWPHRVPGFVQGE